MLFDSREGWPPTPSFLNLYVGDVEGCSSKSIKLGAKSVTDMTALWFGEKVCRIIDLFGNLWWINQRIAEIDFTKPEEIGRVASTPEAVQGIAYIQRSLDEAIKLLNLFLKTDEHYLLKLWFWLITKYNQGLRNRFCWFAIHYNEQPDSDVLSASVNS